MSLFGTGRREAVLVVLLLIGLALVQHGAGIFAGMHRRAVPVPASGTPPPVAGDAAIASNELLLAPAMRQAQRAVAAGELPVWNDAARFGEPFAATGAPVLYPPFWLLAAPGGARWLDLLCWLHAAIACVFAYRFLRAMPVSRYAASMAAGSYALGWFATVGTHRLTEFAAASLLPWVLERTWRCLFARRRIPALIGLCAATAAMFATGGIATATLGAVLATALFVVGRSSIDRADRLRATAAWVGGMLLAALVTAPLWIDFLQHRAAFAPHTAVDEVGIPATGLVALLVPGLFGEAGGPLPRVFAELRSGADPIGYALYPGALALSIAVLAILRPKRNLLSLFWVATAGIALCMSIRGDAGRLLLGWLPDIALRPGAALGILHLALAVLVAFGLEGFFDAPHQRRFALPAACWATLTACLVGAAALAVGPAWTPAWMDPSEADAAWRHLRAQAWIPLASVGAISATLLAWRRLGILRLKTAVGGLALGECVLLALLQVPREAVVDDARVPTELTADPTRVVTFGLDMRLPGNRIVADAGAPTVDTDGSAILDRTARFLDQIDAGMVRVGAHARVRPLFRDTAIADPLLARAGIGAIVAHRLPPTLDFVPTVAAPGGGAARPGLPLVHRASLPVARARLCFDARPVASLEAAERLLATRPPSGIVVVESAGTPIVTRTPRGVTTVAIERSDPTAVDVVVDVADGAGLLVLADAFAPGWEATVDGQPAPLFAADVAFRAVPVAAGRHHVELRYRPWALRFGPSLQAFAAVVLLVLAAAAWRVRRNP